MLSFPVFTRRLLSVILLMALAMTAHAQTNALSNPGFSSDLELTGWEIFFGRTAEWNAFDALGIPNSGSALVTNEGVSDGIVPLVLYQCIQIQGEQEIEFGGDLLVPAGQPNETAAYIFVEPFLNSTCSDPSESFHSAGSGAIGEWVHATSSFNTPSGTQSVRLALGTFKPNGETVVARTFFDNVFLNIPGITQVNPSMSASWFNPDQSGHGIMIHLIDASTAWMCWFAFNNAGDPVWICSLGTIMGDTIAFEDAFTLEGGVFPPDFDPEQIVEVPWGTITVTFTGCNEGMMSWTTNAPGFQSGSMPLVRLTTLWGVACN